jgi:polyphosphate kinase
VWNLLPLLAWLVLLQLRHYFKSSLEPILTPLAVDPGHPFPFIGNLTLSIAVVLRDPYDDTLQFAIVSIPSGVQRWKSLALDNDHEHMQNTFVSVDQIITNNLDLLFGGMEIKSAHMFRTTRNADVARNEEEAEDLLEMITDEVAFL